MEGGELFMLVIFKRKFGIGGWIFKGNQKEIFREVEGKECLKQGGMVNFSKGKVR